MEQEKKLCDEVETVWQFTYLGDRVSVGGGYEAAVTSRTRCVRVKSRECGELLLKLKEAAHRRYIWLTIQCGSEVWCLKENEMKI